MTITSLIPPSVIDMIGGYGSAFYKETFRADCNHFYSEFYKLRHIFYYATECLCSTPSQIGRILPATHEQFFRSLELTFLRGEIISPETAQVPRGGRASRVPISPLVIESTHESGWGSVEGVFAKMHTVVQKFRRR